MKKIVNFRDYKLITEAILHFTEDFYDFLLSIKHPISKELIDFFGVDIKQDMNFLKKSDTVGYVDYISNKAVKKTSPDFDADVKLKWVDIRDLYNNHLVDKKFSPIKLGKLINTLLPGKFTPGEIEEFTNLYKTKQSKKIEDFFEMVSGEDIKWGYNENNYTSCSGSELAKSCMRYAYKSKYLDIYSENPEVVSLLVLKDPDNEDEIWGRALIWKLGKNRDKIGMDRIYACSEHIKGLFEEKRDSEGWINVYDGRGELTVHLDYSDFDYYPYMDTFSRLDPSGGILYNDSYEDSEYAGHYILQQQGGGYVEIEDTVWSEWEDESIPRSESVWSEPLGTYIRDYDTITVSVGSRGNMGIYPNNYDGIVEIWSGEWAREGDVVWSEYLQSYLLDNDVESVIADIDNGNYSPIIEESGVPYDWSGGVRINTKWNWYRVIKSIHSEWSESDMIEESLVSEVTIKGGEKIYIPDIFICEVYTTLSGLKLTKIDAYILNEDLNDNVEIMDIFQYHDLAMGIEDFLDKAVSKRNQIDSIIKGEQGTLELDDIPKYKRNLAKRSNSIDDRINQWSFLVENYKSS